MPAYLLHNLKSSEAALRAILGEQEAAISILNSVLAENKQHWLSLLRRSQIYKKVFIFLRSKISWSMLSKISKYWLCSRLIICKFPPSNWKFRLFWPKISLLFPISNQVSKKLTNKNVYSSQISKKLIGHQYQFYAQSEVDRAGSQLVEIVHFVTNHNSTKVKYQGHQLK